MPLNKTRSISISWNAILQERQLPSVCKIIRHLWRMESFMVRTFNSRGSVIFFDVLELSGWFIMMGGGEREREREREREEEFAPFFLLFPLINFWNWVGSSNWTLQLVIMQHETQNLLWGENTDEVFSLTAKYHSKCQ